MSLIEKYNLVRSARARARQVVQLDFLSVIFGREPTGLGRLERSNRVFTLARRYACTYKRVCLRYTSCESIITRLPRDDIASAEFRLPEGKRRSSNSLFSRCENLKPDALTLIHKQYARILYNRLRLRLEPPHYSCPKSIIVTCNREST